MKGSIKLYLLRRTAWFFYGLAGFIAMLPAMAETARAQNANVITTQTTPQASRLLSVGFLPEGSDFSNDPGLMEQLRGYLLARSKVTEAMAKAGYGGDFELSPCDGPRDMVQRMNQGEFDLVFATAVIFARQTGDYGEPVLMSWRPGDLKQSNDSGVLRRGVVIAGRASSLFRGPAPTEDRKHKALETSPLAVSSEDSAAGYIYPTLSLYTKYGLGKPREYWFCGTDEEVIKHVVSGLAPLGACREGALEELLPDEPDGKYYRILFRTDVFPTDPILLRRELAPQSSELGRELKLAIKDFFKSPEETRKKNSAEPRNLNVENATARPYEKIRRDLEFFARRSGNTATSKSPSPTPLSAETPTGPPKPSAANGAATTPTVRPILPPSMLPPMGKSQPATAAPRKAGH